MTAAADRPNVLITSAARKVLLVRAFADALARTGSGQVIAAGPGRVGPGARPPAGC